MIPQNRPTILRTECITFLFFITYNIFYLIMIQFFCIVDYFVTLRLTSIKMYNIWFGVNDSIIQPPNSPVMSAVSEINI